MGVTYLFRSPGTGHSIEGLFSSIEREVSQQLNVQTARIRLPYISRDLWCIWQNLRFLIGLRSAIFHITGDIHYAALVLPASRVVLTIHDCSTLMNNQKRPIRYMIFWLLWYYLPIRRAGTVTAISEKTRQELIRYVGKVAEKTIVIPNGYDPYFVYQPTEFRKVRPVLLQIGTAPNKNLRRLLEALEGIACTLIIVGSLSESIKQDLERFQIDYRQHENLSQAALVELYTSCDIVTFLSTYEGFGMPVLEANAIGRVVISSSVSPMTEMADGSAHFVDPLDVNAIRKGILRIIQEDGYRQSLIEAGLKNAQQYTVPIAVARYIKLYREIVCAEPTLSTVL